MNICSQAQFADFCPSLLPLLLVGKGDVRGEIPDGSGAGFLEERRPITELGLGENRQNGRNCQSAALRIADPLASHLESGTQKNAN